MRTGRQLRALFLLALLAGSSALAALPAAEAQTAPPAPAAPLICFDKDPRVAGRCAPDGAPSYTEGGDIDITLDTAGGVQTFVSARCVGGCPPEDTSATATYWAIYRGTAIRFPRDFVDKGPEGGPAGGNAVADRAPRYNSTWEVTAQLPGAPIARQFRVWFYDAFAGTNFTVRPGESHFIHATGFDPGATIALRWEKRDPMSGRYEPFRAQSNLRAYAVGPLAGVYQEAFSMPPSSAAEIATCGRALADCYRIVISGTGKYEETVNMLVGPADVRRNLDTTPRPATNNEPTFERTQNATFTIDLNYPGGRVRHGPRLMPSDVPMSPTFGQNALRVAVEKVFRGNDTTYLLDEVPLAFSNADLLWTAQWNIPRNLSLQDSNARYRLRLVEQFDKYGNRVAEDILGNFTVTSANIIPKLAETFPEVERTDYATLRLAVRYHDGKPFQPSDARVEGNTSPLRGCFVRVTPPPPPPAPPASPNVNACGPNDPLTWGAYYDGAWNFTVRYPRDYANLDLHRFILVNNTQDRTGNTILSTTSPAFSVVPAKIRAEFSTVMRGSDAEVLERGNRVFVAATLTYPDGTPYSHSVRVDPNATSSTELQGSLLRRGPAAAGQRYGPLAGEEPFNLTETDPYAGRWSAYLQLTHDDTQTPVGMWTFRFDVVDNLTVPNGNLTSFDREVVSTAIVLCPTFQPPGRVTTGASIKFRFKLFYSECDTGREVPIDALEGKLTARVYRYDAQTRSTTGPGVSNTIVPAHDGRDWNLDYSIPEQLYAGEYAIALTGTDTFGNRLLPTARSRPFTTYTDVLERAVLTQPPTDVRRGEGATVVFDKREGDTGLDPSIPAPRLQLERFDTSTRQCDDGEVLRGCWVRERFDVRIPDPSLSDHVGFFPVDVDTPVGLYRFTLQGRDVNFRTITATSANFSVSSTQVTRALATLPPERIIKGEPFTFYIEQSPGDQIRERVVFFNGRPIFMPIPQIVNEFGRVNVTWAIPFDAPTGNYTLRLTGRDVSGNDILILTPPIEALATSLTGRVLGQPPRVVERGADARLLFAIAYPDGGFYLAEDEPRVFIHNATGRVAQAQVRREGLTFSASWTPPKDTPAGEYYFEVSSQTTGGTGNAFPTLRSNVFRAQPGTVTRPAIDDIGSEGVERLSAAVYTTAFEASDRFVAFELVYYGPSLSPAIDTTAPLPEITRSPIPHTIDPESGKYIARFVTDQQTQVGTFRVVMTGEDGNGNTLTSRGRQFLIRPTTVGIAFDSFPPQRDFGEGKTITMTFVGKYRVGTIMDETFGRPSVVALYNSRPITQRPDIEYVDGRWYLSWTAPDILPPGEYQFAIGGTDLHGNTIASARSTPYVINEGSLAQSASKLVPGPSPVLLLLVLVGLAGVVGRRVRRG